MGRVSWSIIFVWVFLHMHCASAQNNVYVVGDGMGWDIPSNASLFYSTWASGKTFILGDILVFNFVSNQHDVVQVPKASYDACTQDNAVGSVITAGPANITLDSVGDHHYICTLGRHCQFGQKLTVTVLGSFTPGGANPPETAPPATPTTPSPATPEPEACAPTTNAEGPTPTTVTPSVGPPPPDSASPSLTASFLLLLLSTAVATIF